MEKFLTFENQTQTNGKVEAQAKLKQRTRFEGQLKVRIAFKKQPTTTTTRRAVSCLFVGSVFGGEPHTHTHTEPGESK